MNATNVSRRLSTLRQKKPPGGEPSGQHSKFTASNKVERRNGYAALVLGSDHSNRSCGPANKLVRRGAAAR
jgi:hypothetical protein